MAEYQKVFGHAGYFFRRRWRGGVPATSYRSCCMVSRPCQNGQSKSTTAQQIAQAAIERSEVMATRNHKGTYPGDLDGEAERFDNPSLAPKLEEHGFKGIGEDVTNMIRRNPVPALLVGVGVGFLIAQMMRR
jgi:hypothetical protein